MAARTTWGEAQARARSCFLPAAFACFWLRALLACRATSTGLTLQGGHAATSVLAWGKTLCGTRRPPACVGSFGNGHVAEPLGTANPPPLSCHTPSRIAKCQGWHAGLRRLEWQKTARHVGLHLPQVVLAATSTHQPCCPGADFATVYRVGFAISCLVRKVARNKGRGCPRRQRRCDLLRGCGGRLIIEPMRPAPSTFQKLTQEEESDLAPDALLLACLFPRLGPANSSICVCFQASNVSRRRVKT